MESSYKHVFREGVYMSSDKEAKEKFNLAIESAIQNFVDETGIRVYGIEVTWNDTIYKEDKDIVKNIYTNCKFRRRWTND